VCIIIKSLTRWLLLAHWFIWVAHVILHVVNSIIIHFDLVAALAESSSAFARSMAFAHRVLGIGRIIATFEDFGVIFINSTLRSEFWPHG